MAPDEVVLLRAPSPAGLRVASLVLQATGIVHRIAAVEGEHQLLVPEALVPRATRQLELYALENQPRPAVEPIELPFHAHSIAGGILLGFFGMLVAIPLAACAKILFKEFVVPRYEAWTRGRAKDFLPLDPED